MYSIYYTRCVTYLGKCLGDLLGLLLAVPVASCIKTLADAAREGDLRPRGSPPAPGVP